MESLEVSGKTVEEAIQKALEQLNLRREEVEVSVLSEGRQGFLGLGTEEATVIVRPLKMNEEAGDKDVADVAKGVLEALLERMGITASVVLGDKAPAEGDASIIKLDVKGEDLGILIGRRGQTLTSLQHIVRVIVAHQTAARVPIVIDVEGYKQRRYEALQALAWRVAEQVKAKGRPFTLEPMPAYERRIVHLALADQPDVTTESVGDGDERKVVIMPRKRIGP